MGSIVGQTRKSHEDILSSLFLNFKGGSKTPKFRLSKLLLTDCSYRTEELKANIRNKGVWPMSRNLRFNFWTPSISLERLQLQASSLVCGVLSKQNAQIGTKGVWLRSRDLLLNFRTPFISLKRLTLQPSNLVCRLTRRTSVQKCKIRG